MGIVKKINGLETIVLLITIALLVSGIGVFCVISTRPAAIPAEE